MHKQNVWFFVKTEPDPVISFEVIFSRSTRVSCNFGKSIEGQFEIHVYLKMSIDVVPAATELPLKIIPMTKNTSFYSKMLLLPKAKGLTFSRLLENVASRLPGAAILMHRTLLQH